MSWSPVSGLPLGLPGGGSQSAAALDGEGVRERLEELERHHFSGRLVLSAEAWQAEVLLRDGRPVAAGAGRPGLVEPLRGQEALSTLLAEGDLACDCRTERIDGPLLEALGGLDAAPVACDVANVQQLRDLLLELAESGQRGVLHVDVGGRWVRAAVVDGRILGAYSDTDGEVRPTLAPLAELLGDWPADVRWFSAADSRELLLPADSAIVDARGNEIERQITWILSRFEGAWGRLREQGASSYDLAALLRELVAELRSLNQQLATAEADVTTASRPLTATGDEYEAAAPTTDADLRLEASANEQDCGLLLELVAGTLERIAQAAGHRGVAEICRKAALALPVELRMGSQANSQARHGAEHGATL